MNVFIRLPCTFLKFVITRGVRHVRLGKGGASKVDMLSIWTSHWEPTPTAGGMLQKGRTQVHREWVP